MSSDNEYEEGEMLIYADFDVGLPFEELNRDNSHIKFIGIDSDCPRIQINDRFFKGTYQHAVGTNLFFTENENPPPVDEVFQKNPEKFYKYFGSADKVLKFERVLATPKEQLGQTIPEEPEDMSKYDVHTTYEEALNQFLKPGELPPRRIPSIPDTSASASDPKRSKRLTDITSENDGADDDPNDDDYVPDANA